MVLWHTIHRWQRCHNELNGKDSSRNRRICSLKNAKSANEAKAFLSKLYDTWPIKI